MKKYLVTLGILFFVVSVYAQDTRSTETPKPSPPKYQSVKKEKKSFFSFLKKKEEPVYKTREEEIADFRAKMKKVARQKRKEEKLAEKPEYSDPSYFGHKKPPKKRPPGKQKFCKICRIKH